MGKNHLIQIASEKLLKVTERPDIVMSHGKGMYLYDIEDNEYLDFIGGWAVNCLGHSPEIISEILYTQSKQLINASPSFYNVPMLEYAELLLENSCFDRVFFTSTGAEANEGAIKLARKYGDIHKKGAFEIITTKHSFHGRTLATMSASGKQQWETLFEPKTKGFLKSSFNDLDSVESLISDKTCAIMLEPIQGEGGVNIATEGYLNGLRKICDKENILLIFDEIQTGMGRTGKLFCYEYFGIEPDIMTLGKGIGGGYPLSAMLTTENLNIFDPGDQGGTYTAQPLAMSVGLAVLKELLNSNIIENCKNMGGLLLNRLKELEADYDISNIRGKGLLIGFDVDNCNANKLVIKCLMDKLLINATNRKTIRLMPPLILSQKEIDKLILILKKNLDKNID